MTLPHRRPELGPGRCLFLLLSLCLANALPCPCGEGAALFQAALAAEQSHDLAAAQRLYLKLIAEEPASPEPYFRLGEVCLHTGELDLAAARLEKGVELCPPAGGLCFQCGRVLLARGEIGRASAYFLRAAELNKEYARHLSSVAAGLKDNKAAIEALKNYVDGQHKLGRALVDGTRMVVAALVAAGRGEEAVTYAAEQAKAHPAAPELHELWGRMLLELGRPDDARAVFRTGLQAAPTVDLLLGAGLCALKLGDLDGAGKDLREALRQDARNVRANLALAMLHAKQGQKDLARKVFAWCVDQAPGDPAVIAEAGLFYRTAIHPAAGPTTNLCQFEHESTMECPAAQPGKQETARFHAEGLFHLARLPVTENADQASLTFGLYKESLTRDGREVRTLSSLPRKIEGLLCRRGLVVPASGFVPGLTADLFEGLSLPAGGKLVQGESWTDERTFALPPPYGSVTLKSTHVIVGWDLARVVVESKGEGAGEVDLGGHKMDLKFQTTSRATFRLDGQLNGQVRHSEFRALDGGAIILRTRENTRLQVW